MKTTNNNLTKIELAFCKAVCILVNDGMQIKEAKKTVKEIMNICADIKFNK